VWIQEDKESFPCPLYHISDGKQWTTSLNIAEVFGIEHKEVLRAIRNLECSEDFNRRNFALVEYLLRRLAMDYPEAAKSYRPMRAGYNNFIVSSYIAFQYKGRRNFSPSSHITCMILNVISGLDNRTFDYPHISIYRTEDG